MDHGLAAGHGASGCCVVVVAYADHPGIVAGGGQRSSGCSLSGVARAGCTDRAGAARARRQTAPSITHAVVFRTSTLALLSTS